jgi:hypothetical protein
VKLYIIVPDCLASDFKPSPFEARYRQHLVCCLSHAEHAEVMIPISVYADRTLSYSAPCSVIQCVWNHSTERSGWAVSRPALHSEGTVFKFRLGDRL